MCLVDCYLPAPCPRTDLLPPAPPSRLSIPPSQIICAGLLAVEFQHHTAATLPSGVAIGVLVVVCIYVAAFAWSWGPLGWLVPSEIQALETRAAGAALSTATNFLFSFVIGQVSFPLAAAAATAALPSQCPSLRHPTKRPGPLRSSLTSPPPTPSPTPPPTTLQAFLSMMCGMEWGVFLFFAAWIILMTVCVFVFLPETKNVPVESVPALFARHPIWRKVMGAANAEEFIRVEEEKSANFAASKLSNGQ